MKLTLTFLMILIITLSVATAILPIPAKAVTSQPLTAFTGTICRGYHQTGFGLDLGNINYCFSKTKISWVDNWTPQNNFTFNIPKIAGLSLTLTTLQNTTTLDYHLAGTILSRSVVTDFYFVQRGYDYKITIVGTISGSPISFPLSIPLPNVNSNCDTNNLPNLCTSVYQNHLGFDWSDIKTQTPVFNNASRTLTITITNNFRLDPIALDGTQGTNCTANCNTTGYTVALVTALSPDVLMCSTIAGSSANMTLPTDNKGNTWHHKTDKVFGSTRTLGLWYTTWSSSGTDTITLKTTVSANSVARCWGISGADTTTIFDSNAGLPASNSGSGTTASVVISTSNANDFLIGSEANVGSPGLTKDAAFTLIGTTTNANFETSDEYQLVSATQSSLTIQYTWTGTQSWAMIGEAIIQAGSSTTTTSSASCCTLTNDQGLSITYITGGVSATSTASSVTADSNTLVTVVGLYTCTYTILNSSFVYQFTASGLQLYTGAASSSVNDFAAGVNHPLLVTFIETGHVILCIPSNAGLTFQNAFVNSTVVSSSFNSPNLFFSGSGTDEVDFVSSYGQGQNSVSTTTTTTTTAIPPASIIDFSQPSNLAGIGVPIALVIVVAFLFFNSRREPDYNRYDPRAKGNTGQGFKRAGNNGQSIRRSSNQGQGLKRTIGGVFNLHRAGNQGRNVGRSPNSGVNVARANNKGQSVNRSSSQGNRGVVRAGVNKGKKIRRSGEPE